MSGYFDHIGPDSENDLAFKYYDPKKVIMGKTMEEHLRVAVCYWHNFCWDGFDVFGGGTFGRPWHGPVNDQKAAEAKLDAAFSFFEKLGQPFFCFHDTDVMAAARPICSPTRVIWQGPRQTPTPTLSPSPPCR